MPVELPTAFLSEFRGFSAKMTHDLALVTMPSIILGYPLNPPAANVFTSDLTTK